MIFIDHDHQVESKVVTGALASSMSYDSLGLVSSSPSNISAQNFKADFWNLACSGQSHIENQMLFYVANT